MHQYLSGACGVESAAEHGERAPPEPIRQAMNLDPGICRLRFSNAWRPDVNAVAERNKSERDLPRIVRDSAWLGRVLRTDYVPNSQRENQTVRGITHKSGERRHVRSKGPFDR